MANVSRRQVLGGAALAAAFGSAAGRSLSSISLGPRAHGGDGDALVVIFMRGGADGLNIVPPYGDDEYYRLRPTLALPAPRDMREAPKARALRLDDRFGLHPALAPLLPAYQSGRLAVVHAVGSGDQTRSHFEAMATMERGLNHDDGPASGWLARYLDATARDDQSPLRAVSLTDTMPDTLRGAPATAMPSLSGYRLVVPTGTAGAVHHAGDRADAAATTLRAMYAQAADGLGPAGGESLAAMEAIQRLDPGHYSPAPGVRYPATPLAEGMRQVACLLKGGVGLEAAFLEIGGWDTHVAQGRDTGWQSLRLAELGGALAAFADDLGPRLGRVTTVAMTEFGRRAYENSGLGTDHGRASCMFVLGPVVGGRVHADWPGLREDQLEDPGDLRVTTDYRNVLAEILARRFDYRDSASLFPGLAPKAPGIALARGATA